jgi:O-antigen/teichoic acid export membrane protein
VAVACAGQVASWLIYIVLAHRTGVSEFEDFAVAVGAVTLLASFTTLGLEKYALRILPVFYERSDWAGARGYTGFALRRTLWTSIAAGAALALAWGWRDPGSASWTAVAVAMLALPAVSVVQLAVEALTAAGHEVRGLLLYRVGVPCAALALLLLAHQLPLALSGAAAVACWGLGWGLALAVLVRELRRLTPAGVWASSPRVETGWQREAIPFLGFGLALNTIAQAGVLGLEFLGASEVDLGAYAAAAQTTGLVVALATATNRFYAPRLSLLIERGDFTSMENVRRQRMLWVVPVVRSWSSSAPSSSKTACRCCAYSRARPPSASSSRWRRPISTTFAALGSCSARPRAPPACRRCSSSRSCPPSERPVQRSPMRSPWSECTRRSSSPRAAKWPRCEPDNSAPKATRTRRCRFRGVSV